MTLEITTEAQAEAAREILSLYDRIHELRNTLGNGDTQKSKLKAALAAYEAQKAANTVLSEDAMIVLKHKNIANDSPRYRRACMELRDNSLITRNASEVINDAGRAYLAAQKPRELKWEVWYKPTQYFIASTDEKQKADEIINDRVSFGHLNPLDYEVRKV